MDVGRPGFQCLQEQEIDQFDHWGFVDQAQQIIQWNMIPGGQRCVGLHSFYDCLRGYRVLTVGALNCRPNHLFRHRHQLDVRSKVNRQIVHDLRVYGIPPGGDPKLGLRRRDGKNPMILQILRRQRVGQRPHVREVDSR